MNYKKTKLSFNDLAFRLPGVAMMVLGYWAEYNLTASGTPGPTFTVGDKVLPVFGSLGFIGLCMVLAPYVMMGYSLWKNRDANSDK